MAKLKSEDAQQTISNWMRNRMTLEYLGHWEELYNPDFKPLGFEGFRKEVGLNHFTMSPSKWIDGVNAIGIVAQSGRYGGTYADNWWFNHFRRHLSDDQKKALMAYSYPGNVRELINILERAVVFKTTDFAKMLAEHREMNAGLFADGATCPHAADSGSPADIPDDLDDAIRRHVHRVFEKYSRNISKAAAALNITRTTLRKWL